MRTRKWRVFYKPTNKMYYCVGLIDYPHDDTIAFWWKAGDGLSHYRCKKDDIEIMDYIGLEDKQGNSIYEGDGLDGSLHTLYIGFCHKCHSFQFFDIYDVNDCFACNGEFHWCEFIEMIRNKEVKVLGNIWESPSLLKDD